MTKRVIGAPAVLLAAALSPLRAQTTTGHIVGTHRLQLRAEAFNAAFGTIRGGGGGREVPLALKYIS
jgi:hypothetical protein